MAKTPLSPLKAKPLHNAGQSVDEAIDELLVGTVLPYYLVPMFIWILAALEWFASSISMPRQPMLYAALASALSAVSVVRFLQLRTRIRALKLGRDGERAVGQFLEGLREHGARIFHDIPADGFNLDHVVVSKHGVFVVETKTLSKATPQSAITVERGEVLVAGRRMERDPLKQVRAQVSWLARVLEESTGRRLPIIGAVVFPGWFIEPPTDGKQLDVWVLEPKALPSFIQHEPVRLEQEDVALAAFHLSRYVRTS